MIWRRIVSGICGAYLLLSLIFSSLFITVEADHDCIGYDCVICFQIRSCLNGLQQTGTVVPNAIAAVETDFNFAAEMIAYDYHAQSITLQSLYARMDE